MSLNELAYRQALIKLDKDKARRNTLTRAIHALQRKADLTPLGDIDCAEVLAVAPGMSDAELMAHFASLTSFLNKQRAIPAAGVVRQLLEVLKKTNGVDLTSADFWRSQEDARRASLKGEAKAFCDAIAAELPLKVLTPEELTERAAGAGLSSLPTGELATLLNAAGVTVAADFDLPTLKLLRGFTTIGDFAEFRTVADVMLLGVPGEITAIRVIDRLAFGPAADVVTLATLDRAKTAAEQARDSDAMQAAQKVITLLRAEYATPAALRDVALTEVAGIARDLIKRRMPLLRVRDELVTRGIDVTDAARVVTKLSTSAPQTGLGDVATRLAAGSLAEARRLLASLTPIEEEREECARLEAQISSAEQQKVQALARYESAVTARDYGAAAAALREAISIDSDDEDLPRRLGALPPSAPGPIQARAAGAGAAISWPREAGDGVRYTVVRAEGCIPASPTDGDCVAHDVTSTEVTDSQPLIGREVTYAVFATRDGAIWSLPGVVECLLLPPPTEVAATAGTTNVNLAWRTPAAASGVVVQMTAADGSSREFAPAASGELTVRDLVTGSKYRFTLRAAYVVAGARQLSAAAEIDATPRGQIEAVRDLSVGADPQVGHLARWSVVVGYPVELWALPINAEVRAGTWIPLTELGERGTRISGTGGSTSGPTSTLSFGPLADVSNIVAVTVDGDRGLIGASQVTGAAPPVSNVVAEALGDSIRLSWTWPRGDYGAHVEWAEDGHRRTKRVSRATYNVDGGVHLGPARELTDVAVALVVRANGVEYVAPPVSVPLQRADPRVRYSLRTRKPMFGPAIVEATFASSDFSGAADVLVVLKEGSFMPASAADGRIVERLGVDLRGADPSIHVVSLGKVKSPFWVRVFPASAEIRLQDPPTNQMRG